MASPAVTGPMLKLNNGVEMPALGFGTFANEGSKGETHKAVIHALNAGYRHLDCAWFYQNEEEVGSGMREFLAANPSVKRSDIFICTKVWNHLHEPEDVEWSIKSSLEKLQTPYVDAFLIHWPIASERNEDRTVKIGADGKVSIPFPKSLCFCKAVWFLLPRDLPLLFFRFRRVCVTSANSSSTLSIKASPKTPSQHGERWRKFTMRSSPAQSGSPTSPKPASPHCSNTHASLQPSTKSRSTLSSHNNHSSPSASLTTSYPSPTRLLAHKTKSRAPARKSPQTKI